MKISGKHFKRGMPNNYIAIEKDYVLIHSFDGTTGIYRMEQNEFGLQEDGKIEFNLVAKDFNLLSKFNELDVELVGDSICFKSGVSKFKIQNYELSLNRPDTTGAVEVNVPIDIMNKCIAFADSSRKECAGVLVYENSVVGSSGSNTYKKGLKTNTQTIHIPGLFLKNLEKDNYSIKSTGKVIFASKQGEIVYSPLYEQKITMLENYDPKFEGTVSIDCNELIAQLQNISLFSNHVCFEIKNDKLNLSSLVDEGIHKEFTSSIKIVKTNIQEYKQVFRVDHLLKVIDAVSAKEISIDKNALMMKSGNELSVTMVVSNQNSKDLKIKAVVVKPGGNKIVEEIGNE